MGKLSRRILQVVVWGLVIAGLLGALMLVIEGAPPLQDEASRLVLTTLQLAAAALIAQAIALSMDRPVWRAAGLVALVGITIKVLIGLVLLWELSPGGFVDAGRLGFTAFYLGVTGTAAVIFTRLIPLRGAWLAGWTGLGLSAAVFGLFMLGTWLPGSSGFLLPAHSWDWTGTGVAVALYGLPATGALAGAALTERPWRWLGVVLSPVGAGWAIYGIWADSMPSMDEPLWIAITAGAVVVAHANLLLMVPLARAGRWLRIAVITAAVVTGFSVAQVSSPFSAWGLAWFPGEAVLAVGAVLASAGTLAVLILGRLRRPVAIDRPPASVGELVVVCPVCETGQRLPVGSGRCSQCAAQFELRVHEPRCAHCHYSLYRIESDHCPECGAAIDLPPAGGAVTLAAADARG